ncbi:MAG: hypothetical protein OEV78_03735 [Spirochaetia bacterium]|nr:hypothetical protein [Spirochaetia bacterium]
MFEDNKIDTKKLSDFYQKVSIEIEQLEADLFSLEKEYFAITPVYEKLFNRIENIHDLTAENHATLLNFRIKNLQNEITRFHKNSGYNLNAFHSIFKHLHTIKNKLPDEIFSEPAYKIIKEKIRMEASKWIPDGLPGKSPLHKYLSLVNDDTYYLIPFKRKLWEKKVENKIKVRIQIKSIPDNNVFLFRCLPGNDQINVKEKLAVLLESENGIKFGILTDRIEGTMIFSEKFLKKKTDYFPVSDAKFTPYLHIHGKRYFIRDYSGKES